ncbi:RpiR family transcriptional regulator [Ligilactobacillus salitolerans]|uniref:RpiR family transcriptional regulator n=1 Tax=Ligilactobacillus salitolerans TaxID=1808352 RepID=A0A401IVL1_9LACO|nr:MurR/RpiR family transcriptional regulator [Ligilactobacillus salitolerans]GBG95593.1 RpiR family transcriptional regulator [Ligilactobacillus salitolerans]
MENILVLIQHNKEALSKKEQGLCDYILAQPAKVMQFSVQSLAQECHVSAATVVRFCRRLGLNGYSDLKLRLSAALQEAQAQEYAEIEPGESAAQVSAKLQLHFDNALKITAKQLDDQTVEQVVTLIHRAPKVQLFGLVSSYLVAQDIYQKLSRIGVMAQVNNDLHLAVTSLAAGSDEDLLVLISTSGETKEILALFAAAHKKQVTTVLLTATPHSRGAGLADYVLETQKIGESPIRPGASTSLMSEFFVADILLFTYVARYHSEVVANLRESRRLVEEWNQEAQ